MSTQEFHTPILGHLKARTFRPLEFFQGLTSSAQSGVTELRYFIKRAYFISDPDLAHKVLTEQSKEFVRGFGYEQMRPFMGYGIVTTDGEFWLKHRRMMHSAFASKQYDFWIQVINQETDKIIAEWSQKSRNNEKVTISYDLLRLTTLIICRAMFGFNSRVIEKQALSALEVITENVFFRVLAPLPFTPYLKINKHREFMNSVQEIRKIAAEIISEGQPENDGSLLGILKSKMSTKEAIDEVVTIFLAGLESTAATLSWTLLTLERHPSQKAKLQQEIDKHYTSGVISHADLNKYEYSKWTLQEILRLYPAIWVLARENKKSESLMGYEFKKRSIIQISPYSLHRDERYWPQANIFNPERWATDPAKNLPKGCYIPFGAGPHICIGAALSMMEMQITLIKMVKSFDFKIDNLEAIQSRPQVTLRPSEPLTGYLSLRTQ